MNELQRIMNELQNNEYQQIKLDITNNLITAAESFFHIGYRLKQVQEQRLYEIDGYKDIVEFGLMEYRFSRTTTQRYIHVYERFSADGKSLEIKEEFQGMQIAVLQELLPLSEEEAKLFTDKSKVEDIRDYKREKKEYIESQIVDNSDGGEEKKEESSTGVCDVAHIENINTSEDEIHKIVRGIFGQKGHQHDRHEQMLEIKKVVLSEMTMERKAERVSEIVNPNGNDKYMAMPLTVFLYEYSKGLKMLYFGSDKQQNIKWEEIYRAILDIFNFSANDPWIDVYLIEEETPKKPEPVKTTAKVKPVQKVESKELKKEKPKEKENKTEVEEQIPGQQSILDYEEDTPEDQKEQKEKPLAAVEEKMGPEQPEEELEAEVIEKESPTIFEWLITATLEQIADLLKSKIGCIQKTCVLEDEDLSKEDRQRACITCWTDWLNAKR